MRRRGPCAVELIERRDALVRDDLATERAQGSGERVGDALRTTARQRPACRVRRRAEDDRERSRERRVERQEGMRGEPGDQRARPRAAKPEARGGKDRAQAEARQQERMAGQPHHRPQHVVAQLAEALREWADHPAVGSGILAEPRGRLVERADQRDGGAVVEWMRDRDVRMDPLQPVAREIELGEERRGRAQRVDRRAHVVHESRQRQPGAARAAADGRFRLVDPDAEARARKHDGSREPVRAATDDGGIHSAKVQQEACRRIHANTQQLRSP